MWVKGDKNEKRQIRKFQTIQNRFTEITDHYIINWTLQFIKAIKQKTTSLIR